MSEKGQPASRAANGEDTDLEGVVEARQTAGYSMRAHVIDEISFAGYDDRPNEDRYGYAGSYAWVIDGASAVSYSGTPLVAKDGESDVSWLAENLSSCLKKHASVTDCDIEDLLQLAVTDLMIRFVEQANRQPENILEEPLAAVTIIHKKQNCLEAATLDDTIILVEGKPEFKALHHEPIQHDLDQELLDIMQRIKQKDGLSLEDAKVKAWGGFRNSRHYANQKDGWWVTSATTKEPVNHLKSLKKKVTSGTKVLLMSDGFYALADCYHRYSDAELVEVAESKGLLRLYGELREIEERDSHADRYLRAKKSDDATALLISL